MTEEDWLAAGGLSGRIEYRQLSAALSYAMKQGWNRKLRLFACGCVRRFWHLLPEGAPRSAVEISERRADDTATGREMREAHKEAANRFRQACDDTCDDKPNSEVTEAIRLAMWCATKTLSSVINHSCFPVSPLNNNFKYHEQAALFKDIFGNPYWPVAFDPAWRSESVVSLARAAYDSRNFTLLPILADALEEAGCDHPDVLAHCRGPGPHVRGCCVVDLVLGEG